MATDSHDSFAAGIDLPGDVVEDILDSQRRRTMLSCLDDHGGTLTVDRLASCVCAREQGIRMEGVTDRDRQTAYDDIYDNQLPKLTATGVVGFDSLHDSVELVRGDLIGNI